MSLFGVTTHTTCKKCEPRINVEVSSITVGDNGNIDALLNSLSYEVAGSELALA